MQPFLLTFLAPVSDEGDCGCAAAPHGGQIGEARREAG